MPASQIYSDSFFSMGTRCDVVLFGIDRKFGEQVFQMIKNEIFEIEHQLSRFISDSTINELNKAGKGIWLDVPPLVWEVLTICYDFYQISNGAFDVTYAPLFNLWKNKPTDGWLPECDIEQAKERCGFEKVKFDLKKQRIKFLAEGVEFDLGAIGKGYAIDSLREVLISQKIENAIINLGDSSVLALGNHPNGEKWPIGIRNAFTENEYVHVFQTSNETITTSGTVLNSEKNKKNIRTHIIDPMSGKPVDFPGSVSIKSHSATFGEFLSTSWMILPENDKNILSDKCRNIEILEVIYESDTKFKTKLTIL